MALPSGTDCRYPPFKHTTESTTPTCFMWVKIKDPIRQCPRSFLHRKKERARFDRKTLWSFFSDLAMINKINRPISSVSDKSSPSLCPLQRPTPIKLLTHPHYPSSIPSVHSRKWHRIIIHYSATPIDDALNMHKVHQIKNEKWVGLSFCDLQWNTKSQGWGNLFYNWWKGQLDGGHVKNTGQQNQHWNLSDWKL